MGKIRNPKFSRLHKPAVPVTNEFHPDKKDTSLLNPTPIAQEIRLEDNPFNEIKISEEQLKPSYIPFNNLKDKCEITTTHEFIKSKKDAIKKTCKKVDKKKLRREMFLKKLQTTRTVIKQNQEAQKRAEVPIIGDVHPMQQALEDLAMLPAPSKKRTRKTKLQKRKAKNNICEKLTPKDLRKTHSAKVQKHKNNEILKIQKLIKNPSYKGNANDTIRNAILENISLKKL